MKNKISFSLFNKFVYETNNNRPKYDRVASLLKYGVFIPKIEDIDKKSFNEIFKVVKANFVSSDELQKTFFKYFEEQPHNRIAQICYQILSYSTTYGTDFEGEMWVPNNFDEIKAELPEKVKPFEMMDKNEFNEKLIEFVKTQKTIDDNLLSLIVTYAVENDVKFEKIASRQLLRKYVVATNNFNLIDNVEERLKAYVETKVGVDNLIVKKDYVNALNICNNIKDFKDYFTVEELATIFNRWKDLLIGLKDKDIDGIRTYINKVSKLSKKLHIPKITPDYLLLTSKEDINVKNVIEKLETPYLIKLSNAFKKRIIDDKNYIYTVRNGKVWVETNKLKISKETLIKRYTIVLNEIEKRVKNNLEKYNIKLTNKYNVDLALPESFKKVVGAFPYFTKIKRGEVLGIYWEGEGVDLDLRFESKSFNISWESGLRKNNDIIHSGDITDGRYGATEALLIRSMGNALAILSVHGYRIPSKNCNFKFFIKEKGDEESFYNDEMGMTKLSSINDIMFSKDFDVANGEVITLGFVKGDYFYFGKISFSGMTTIKNNDFNLYEAIESKCEGVVRLSDLNIDIYTDEKSDTIDVADLSLDDLRKIFS